MKPKSAFVISEFTNPSGEIAYRVSGWLDGKRVRKNFPSRAEAEAERQVLEVQRLQTDTGIRTAVTRLSGITWLQQSPGKPTAARILDHLERLKFINELKLPLSVRRHAHENRLLKLARIGCQMTVQHLRDLKPLARYWLYPVTDHREVMATGIVEPGRPALS